MRTLFSLDGGRTLQPFETPVERAVDPLQVYVAVRQLGYWAEGFRRCRIAACVRERASAALRSAVGGKPAGAAASAARGIAQAIRTGRSRIRSRSVAGNAIGLALEAHPLIAAGSEERFEAGVSLR